MTKSNLSKAVVVWNKNTAPALRQIEGMGRKVNKTKSDLDDVSLPIPKNPTDLLELGKLARERNEIDYQISDAESTIASLEGMGKYEQLIASTRENIDRLKDRRHALDKILATMEAMAAGRMVDRDHATPPPCRGKELNASLIYAYMNEHPDGKQIVAEEFWEQINKEAGNGCWEVRFEVTRSKKGAIKKVAHIPWLGKGLPATRLAWYLTGQVMDPNDSNIYNECGNDKCVNPAHHYQGALGKIRKQVAREKHPDVLSATFNEVNEWVTMIFDYISGRINHGWNAEHGFTFKELEAQFVPSEIPTGDDLRKALNCKRGKSLFELKEGKWYATGMQEVKR
jgi:hypothetical protein